MRPEDARAARPVEALEQLAYTADELAALAPLLRRVPVEVLAVPSILRGESQLVSILAVLGAFCDREQRLLIETESAIDRGNSDLLASADSPWRVLIADDMQPAEQAGEGEQHTDKADRTPDAVAIVQQAAAARTRIVQALGRGFVNAKTQPDSALVRRLYELIHDDSSILREIALALHAGPVTGRSQ